MYRLLLKMSFNFKILLFEDKKHIGYLIEHNDDEYYDDDEICRSILVIKNRDTNVHSKLYKRWNKNVRIPIRKTFGNYERVDCDSQEVYDVISKFCDDMIETSLSSENYNIPLDEITMIEDILHIVCMTNPEIITC